MESAKHGLARVPKAPRPPDPDHYTTDPTQLLSSDELGDGAAPVCDAPSIPVIDLNAIDAAVLTSGYDGSGNDEALSSAEEQRIRQLLRYRYDPALHKRAHVAAPAMIEQIDALGSAQPNFSAVTALVRQAVLLSLATGSPLRVPPLLLVGRPGTGKSRYARALAAALDMTGEVIDGAAIPDVGSIVGYPPVWKAAGPGYVARTLVRARTAAPLIMVDEIEKIVDVDRSPHPENKLLALLERGTAAAWQDEFLRVPMRADGIVWVFTANDVTTLSKPFLDRVIVIPIPDLPRAARDRVLEAMLAEVAAACGATVRLENRDALGPLQRLGLRRSRLALELAVARAVADGRSMVKRNDIAQAAKLLGRRTSRPANHSEEKRRLRAPLGFIDLRARRKVTQGAKGPNALSTAAL